MNAPLKKLKLKKPSSSTSEEVTPPLKKTPTTNGGRKLPKEIVPALYSIPGLPLKDGPPPVKQGEGTRLLESVSPLFVITLDAGTFRYVWEMVEGKARRDHQSYTNVSPAIMRVSEEAVRCFRAAAGNSVSRKLRIKK